MKVPAYRKIQNDLTELIDSGALAPGERIWSIREIKERYQVSQITALRVFRELLQCGKIYRNGGSAYHVAYPQKSSQTVFCAFRALSKYNPDDSFGNRILSGIFSGCRMNQLSLHIPVSSGVLNMVDVSDHSARQIGDELAEFDRPAGILLDMRLSDRQIEKFILPHCGNLLPVIVGRHTELKLPYSAVPGEECGHEAAALAAKCGAEQFLIFSCFETFDEELLLSGFRHGLLEQQVREIHLFKGAQSSSKRNVELLEIARKAVGGNGKCCFFCTSDFWGRPLCDQLIQDGFQPGKDFSLISCGGYGLAFNHSPKLCTIRYDAEGIGFQAASLATNGAVPFSRPSDPLYRIEINETL